MVDKPISKEHINFCKLVSEGQEYLSAYVTACNPKLTNNSNKVTASRLAKKYTLYIAELKDKATKLVESAHDSDVVKNALNAILTQAEVDAELCKIMKKAKYDGDKLKAIDLYNKRFGSNAPVKSDVKLTDMVAPVIKKSAK